MTKEHDAEAVERVAKAIYEGWNDQLNYSECGPMWEDFPDHHGPWLASARAALSAMQPQEVSVQDAAHVWHQTEGPIYSLVDIPGAYIDGRLARQNQYTVRVEGSRQAGADAAEVERIQSYLFRALSEGKA